jgi:UDP-N-acetylmuramoylalanine--D-glutamate ligase
MTRVLVYGMGVAGEATARALLARGARVVVADDRPTAMAAEVAAALGVDFYERPADRRIARLVERVDLIVPSPGVPERHPVFAAARRTGVPVRTEIDLAWEWEQDRPGGPRPMVAITGTDGKTTTVLMATAMLDAAGVSAVAAGNTEVPLVAALDRDVDAFVVECTSFRLAFISGFRAEAAVWLNLAADHLDWHDHLSGYEAAKARIYEYQRPDDVAIGSADDPVVLGHLASARARHVTFGHDHGDYRVEDGALVGPPGVLAEIGAMARALPHDRTNALAAAAAVLESGLAPVDAIEPALASFEAPRHRIELVGDAGGVGYYDDSKATTPHAVITAIRGFERVVLIAGGRNKGLDLGELAAEPGRMVAVVAIGEAAADVAAAFDGVCAVDRAASMDDAVRAAAARAQPGDVVLLSPGCASFDAYTGYGARGDDFARAVREEVFR